jgi:hypothetical protein
VKEEHFPFLVIVLGCFVVIAGGFIPDESRSQSAITVGTNLVTMGGTAYQVRIRYGQRREDD